MKNLLGIALAALLSSPASAGAPTAESVTEIFRSSFQYGSTHRSTLESTPQRVYFYRAAVVGLDIAKSSFSNEDFDQKMALLAQTEKDVMALLSDKNLSAEDRKKLVDVSWWGLSRKMVYEHPHNLAVRPLFSGQVRNYFLSSNPLVFNEKIDLVLKELESAQQGFYKSLTPQGWDSLGIHIGQGDQLSSDAADRLRLEYTDRIYELSRMRAFLTPSQSIRLQQRLSWGRSTKFPIETCLNCRNAFITPLMEVPGAEPLLQ